MRFLKPPGVKALGLGATLNHTNKELGKVPFKHS